MSRDAALFEIVGDALGRHAAVALGFAGYLSALTELNPIWSASLLVVTSACLLVYGIQQAAWVAGVCTALELVGLAVVLAVGVPKLGSINYLATAPAGASGVMSAAALVFFAYIGFEEIVQLAEETREPTRNIPRALLLSIAITTVLYALVAIAAVSVLGWEELGSSDSPLADVAAVALGRRAFVGLSIIALLSTANTVLILIMSAARLLYGMAEDGKMPRILAAIHETRQSPYMATVAIAAVSVAIIATLKKIAAVANLTNFALLAAFVIINVVVVVLRYKEPNTHRPFRIPGRIGTLPLVPVLGIITSLLMIAYVGLTAILMGLSLCALGMLIYMIPIRRSDDSS